MGTGSRQGAIGPHEEAEPNTTGGTASRDGRNDAGMDRSQAGAAMTDEREGVEQEPWFQDMKALMLNSAGLWKGEIGSLEKQRWIDMADNAEHALFAAYRAGQASLPCYHEGNCAYRCQEHPAGPISVTGRADCDWPYGENRAPCPSCKARKETA